jgi:hypothetical protein
VFDILRDAYATAVERLEELPGLASLAGDPREHTGDHLFHYRITGATAGDEDLFARFWERAGSELRREVITHAGWSLERTADLDAELATGVKQAWEWVLAAARDEDREALAGFGAWLGAPALDGGWLLEQAREVLSLRVHLWPEHTVYAAAERFAGDDPVAAVAVLRGMVESDAEGWSIDAAREQVRAALQAAMATGDETARVNAIALIELLAARGLRDFADLL